MPLSELPGGVSRHLAWRWRHARRQLDEAPQSIAARVAPTGKLTFRHLGAHGRLGNQLFQIAGTLGLARARGTEAVFPKSWKYRDLFSLPDHFYGGALTVVRSVDGWKQTTADPWFMRPYLQDISLWGERRHEIWTLLQPSSLAVQRAIDGFGGLLSAENTTALHVRRSDYLTRNVIVPLSYYEQALDDLVKRHGEGQVLVFSDDADWCRANLSIADAVYLHGNPDWLDLTLMSLCDHHICANSTFSWWGAFLSEDPTPIAPWFPGEHPDFSRLNPGGWRLVKLAT